MYVYELRQHCYSFHNFFYFFPLFMEPWRIMCKIGSNTEPCGTPKSDIFEIRYIDGYQENISGLENIEIDSFGFVTFQQLFV